MLRQDILFDLPTFSMISENWYTRVKTCHMECHDIADFFLFVLQIHVKKKIYSAKNWTFQYFYL